MGEVQGPAGSKFVRRNVVLLVVATAVGVLILSSRNLYEDEWTTLSILTRSYREIIDWSLRVDVHPPGVYLIDRGLSGLGFEGRTLGLAHLAIWTVGALSFVSGFSALLASEWGRSGFLAITLLHPHVLTWNTSLRWCSVWWGIALFVVAVALGTHKRASLPGWGASTGVGALLGALAHLDYLALGFGPCLAVAWLVRWGTSRASLLRIGTAGLIALAIASPLAVPLSSILAAGGPPQMDPPRLAILRMAHVLSLGEPILPWHPVAPIVVAGLLVPSAVLALRRLAGASRKLELLAQAEPSGRRILLSLSILLLLMALGILAGFGNRGYTSLGLTPIVALWIIYGLESVDSAHWRKAVSLLLVVWIGVGIYHLAARKGNAKRQFNDKPEQIIDQLQRATEGFPAVVITDDAVLTFEINAARRRADTSLVTCSAIADDVHGYPAGTKEDIATFHYVIVLDHPEGTWNEMGHYARIGIDQAKRLLDDPRELMLAEDPDWQWKNRLTNAGLAKGRLRATYGRPLAGDWDGVKRSIREASAASILGSGREVRAR